MFFCPICRNNLDIKPASQVQTGGSSSASQSGGLSIEEIINLALENDLHEEDVKSFTFDESSLQKNTLFRDLSNENKEIVLNRIKEHLPVETKTRHEDIIKDIPFFHCSDCGESFAVKSGTKLYTKSYGGVDTTESTYNKNMIYSKILPFTRKYTCPNKLCVSHTDILKREAVIYRPNHNKFKTYYMCVACRTNFPADKPLFSK
jgi:uncharacterized protein YlaI